LNISNNIAKLSTGVITSYALYILIGLIFYLLFYSYINNSIITLALLISLSLLLYSKASNYSTSGLQISTLLHSSNRLEGLMMVLETKVDNLPSGEEIVRKVGKNVNSITEEIGSNMKELNKMKKDVIERANIELNDANISPDTAYSITTSIEQAKDLVKQGGEILIEATQAALDSGAL
jgi:hypothetical protein